MSLIVTDVAGSVHDVDFNGEESCKELYARVAECTGLLAERFDLQFAGEVIGLDSSTISALGMTPGSELEVCDKAIWPDKEVEKLFKDDRLELGIAKASKKFLEKYIKKTWPQRTIIPLIERGMLSQMLIENNGYWLRDERVIGVVIKHVHSTQVYQLFENNESSFNSSVVLSAIAVADHINAAEVYRILPTTIRNTEILNSCYSKIAGTSYLQYLYKNLSETDKTERANDFFMSAADSKLPHVIGELYRNSPNSVKCREEIIKLTIENGSPFEMERLISEIPKVDKTLLTKAFDRCSDDVVGDFLIAYPDLSEEQISSTFSRNPNCILYVMGVLRDSKLSNASVIRRIAVEHLQQHVKKYPYLKKMFSIEGGILSDDSVHFKF